MAWINKNTFRILQTLSEQHITNDFFEVDDAIALPVAVLNRKGYITTECCAGHPFQTESIIESGISYREHTLEELFQELFDGEDTEDATMTVRVYAEQRAYVEFKAQLPDNVEAPEGWKLDTDRASIYAHFTKTSNPFAFFKDQYRFMKSLMRWVKALP